MSRPTKEEAREYARQVLSDHVALARCEEIDPDEIYAWLQRVAAALPSAQAVQRDRERRKAAAPSHPEGCSCGDPECPQSPFRPQ